MSVCGGVWMLTASFDPELPMAHPLLGIRSLPSGDLKPAGPRTTLVSSFRVNQNVNPLLEWCVLN